MKSKVFGVGLSRTATTSLTIALLKLGYNAKHYPKPTELVAESQNHDALTDIPVILAYRQFDSIYPNAKFILTEREMEPWLDSCERHWGKKKRRKSNPIALLVRRAVFGVEMFDRKLFKVAYRIHRDQVLSYFSGRPGKLLIMNICDGDGYEKLCPFLGLDIPEEPFPHDAGGGIKYENY